MYVLTYIGVFGYLGLLVKFVTLLVVWLRTYVPYSGKFSWDKIFADGFKNEKSRMLA